MSWIRVCHESELTERRGRCVRLGELALALFKTSHGAVLAVEDRCPHKGGPLSEGLVADACVTCPLHGFRIDLVTGAALAPDRGRVRTFPTLVERGEVWVRADVGERPLPTLEEVFGVHPDNGRPRLGRRRATPADFTLHDLDRPLPVLAVEPPSPDTEASLRLRLTDPDGTSVELGLCDLRERFPVQRVATHLTCLMFGFTRPVTWTGIRLADVLASSPLGTQPFYSFYSWDTADTAEEQRFFETLPRAYALDPRTMLVFAMNDGPLPKEHGGPLRLVVPFLQGYKSVKWLSWIKGCYEDEIGYKKLHGFIEAPELGPTG